MLRKSGRRRAFWAWHREDAPPGGNAAASRPGALAASTAARGAARGAGAAKPPSFRGGGRNKRLISSLCVDAPRRGGSLAAAQQESSAPLKPSRSASPGGPESGRTAARAGITCSSANLSACLRACPPLRLRVRSCMLLACRLPNYEPPLASRQPASASAKPKLTGSSTAASASKADQHRCLGAQESNRAGRSGQLLVWAPCSAAGRSRQQQTQRAARQLWADPPLQLDPPPAWARAGHRAGPRGPRGSGCVRSEQLRRYSVRTLSIFLSCRAPPG
jgi:hypothetical protein